MTLPDPPHFQQLFPSSDGSAEPVGATRTAPLVCSVWWQTYNLAASFPELQPFNRDVSEGSARPRSEQSGLVLCLCFVVKMD